MKKNLFLYLFIFALLTNVFTYMYFTNKQKFEDGRIAKMEQRVKSVKDSLQAEKDKSIDNNYFSLENNTNAQAYFEGADVGALALKVRDGLYAKNVNEKGNTLIPYPMMDNRPFTINRMKILNNRWIVADFSNGLRWGELLIKYFVEEDGSITYETAESLLHNFRPY